MKPKLKKIKTKENRYNNDIISYYYQDKNYVTCGQRIFAGYYQKAIKRYKNNRRIGIEISINYIEL